MTVGKIISIPPTITTSILSLVNYETLTQLLYHRLKKENNS